MNLPFSYILFENWQPFLLLVYELSLVPTLSLFCFLRYAYLGDASEEFDKDDTTLTLIKPSLTPAKDVLSAPEARAMQSSNGLSKGGDEEDKIE